MGPKWVTSRADIQPCYRLITDPGTSEACAHPSYILPTILWMDGWAPRMPWMGIHTAASRSRRNVWYGHLASSQCIYNPLGRHRLRSGPSDRHPWPSGRYSNGPAGRCWASGHRPISGSPSAGRCSAPGHFRGFGGATRGLGASRDSQPGVRGCIGSSSEPVGSSHWASGRHRGAPGHLGASGPVLGSHLSCQKALRGNGRRSGAVRAVLGSDPTIFDD